MERVPLVQCKTSINRKIDFKRWKCLLELFHKMLFLYRILFFEIIYHILRGFIKVAISSHLQFKTSRYYQIKALNERISEWAHLSLQHYQFSRYVHLKFNKQGIFLTKLPLHEISQSGDKIFMRFQNRFFSSYFVISPELLHQISSLTPLSKANLKLPDVEIMKF